MNFFLFNYRAKAILKRRLNLSINRNLMVSRATKTHTHTARERLSIMLSGIGEKTGIKCPFFLFFYFIPNFTWIHKNKLAFVTLRNTDQLNLLQKIQDTIRLEKAKHQEKLIEMHKCMLYVRRAHSLYIQIYNNKKNAKM